MFLIVSATLGTHLFKDLLVDLKVKRCVFSATSVDGVRSTECSEYLYLAKVIFNAFGHLQAPTNETENRSSMKICHVCQWLIEIIK